MAFPAIHYGNFGDEKVTSTAKIAGLPLGIKMVFPDGREFVHARAGGTALVAGKLYQASTAHQALADTIYAKSLLPSAAYAVGATTIAMTAGGTTAVLLDQFADGFLTAASSTGTGIGYSYKVKSNNSCATAATCTVTLYDTDGIKVAVESGTTTFGLTENKYAKVELSLASTVGWPLCGVACNSAAASAYVWLATRGPAPVFVGGTVLLERSPVVCSTVVAGAVVPIVVAATSALLDTKQSFDVVGIGLNNAFTAGFAVVDLRLS